MARKTPADWCFKILKWFIKTGRCVFRETFDYQQSPGTMFSNFTHTITVNESLTLVMLLDKRHYLSGLLLLLCTFVPGAVLGAPTAHQAANRATVAKSSATETATKQQKLDPVLVAEKKQNIEKYEQLVQQLESQGGVYEVQLSEVLLDLGKTYQSLELHSEALATFKRSLQISRVNSGLYSLEQMPILEQILKSNKALQDWDRVNKNYAYLYWVNKRNYGDFDPQLLPVIDRLGKWHLYAYTEAIDERPALHLLQADSLYSKAIAIIELRYGKHAPQLLQALYGLALTNYQMAAHASTAEKRGEPNYGIRAASYNQKQRARQQEFAHQDLIFRSYARGKKAMLRIVAIHASNDTLPVDNHALALTHLGDWYLLFNKHNSATASYGQAYRLMNTGAESKKDIDHFFARPRMLPTIQFPIADEEALKITDATPYAVAMFTVSPGGRAHNIEIVEISPTNDNALKRRARKNIAGSKFRPRFENGKPVETTGFTMRYILDQ